MITLARVNRRVGQYSLLNFCINFIAGLSGLSFCHFLPARAFCLFRSRVLRKFSLPTGYVKYCFLRILINFASQVQLANKQTALINLGIYLRITNSRALHLSLKVLEVSLNISLNLVYKIVSFLTFERSL